MGNATILIVDDNEDNLSLIEDALSEEGLKILCARSGPDAISLLLSQKIDLVLLDIMMPDMNGFAVLEMIRFMPRLVNTAVIIQTAHGDRHNVERAKELGAKAVLTKPVSPAAIRAEVRECLGLEHPSAPVSVSL
jgi:CheY-like chemotaxis protein